MKTSPGSLVNGSEAELVLFLDPYLIHLKDDYGERGKN